MNNMAIKEQTNFILILAVSILLSFDNPVKGASNIQYQLFKNSESFGILVFPPSSNHYLNQYIKSLNFLEVESGKAVFRYGTKGENGTYMMPESTQEKHRIKKFITIQIISEYDFMIGIYDMEWGLTLPRAPYTLKELQKNIPKTLQIFRGIEAPMHETHNSNLPFLPKVCYNGKINTFFIARDQNADLRL